MTLDTAAAGTAEAGHAALPPPRLRAPPGACDCHMHIFDPRFTPRADTPYQPPVASVGDYMAVRRRLGLSRAVVIQSVTHGTDNRNLVAALRGFEGTARGIAVIDPEIGEAELASLNEEGVRGVRFEMVRGVLGWDALERIAERIAPHGWHIDLQTDGREIPSLVDRLLGLACPVVFDHYGKFVDALSPDHPAVQGLLTLLGSGRAWVKLTAPYAGRHGRPEPWPELRPMARAFLERAPGRVVWGSEWPQSMLPVFGIPVPDHALLLDLLLDYTDDPALIRRVLVDNPAELYGFPTS